MLQKQKPKNHRRNLALLGVSVGLAIIVFVFLKLPKNSQNSQVVIDDKAATSSSVAGATDESDKIAFFTGEQFQNLYDSLAMPNTEMLEIPPVITGNAVADARIRDIAERRGYSLRSVPVFPIQKSNEPGLDEDDLLQPNALISWKDLLQKAKKSGVPIKLNSGYRSIEMQRKLFLGRLSASPATIVSGHADAAVLKVLSQAAPPGYSRHHTGYTIDLICNDGTGRQFKQTNCFTWMKSDNYKNAKQSGWVPSYPEGASKQGPEPEPWEYVWVGQDAVRE